MQGGPALQPVLPGEPETPREEVELDGLSLLQLPVLFSARARGPPHLIGIYVDSEPTCGGA